MKKSRITIANLMLTVLFVAVFLAAAQGRVPPRVILVLGVGAVLLSPYVLGPILIHRTQWVAARPEFIPIDPDGSDLLPEALGALREAEPALVGLGFVHRRTYRSKSMVPNTEGFVSVFQNERTKEAAKVVTSLHVPTHRVASLLVFISEYPDDTEIITSNSRVPSITPRIGPPVHIFVFPRVSAPRSLLEIHRRLAERTGPPALPRDPMASDPDAFLQRTEQRWVDHARTIGYYRLDETETIQRPTWKGAILMTWRLLWPMKPIRLALRRWRAARLLRSLHLDAHVPAS